jgi:hypothetical protein
MDEESAAQLVAELRDIERRRLAALIHADAAESHDLHAEAYQLITPGGASLSKDEYLGQVADGSLAYRRFEPNGEIAVHLLGPSAAALRYQVTIDAVFPGGHDVDRFWHTDIYERRDGRWQAVWSQATRIARR